MTRAADVSPALAKVIEAAKQEKRLRLSWSDETLGGAAGARELQDAMNKMFSTSIEVQFAPSSLSMGQMGNQVAAEAKAGRPARMDVFLASASGAGRLADGGVFQQVDWPAMLPGRLTPAMVEGNGRFIRFVTFVAGITYNTKLLPNPPKSIEGFLAPEFKGRLASTASASHFDILASSDIYGPDRGIAYAKKLSGQISGLMRCSEGERIASGEFVALIFDCGSATAARLAPKGAPIAQLLPQETSHTRTYFYLGVPANAAQPNAAKMFVTFMMTEEGQRMAWKHWQADLHMLPGSNTEKQINAGRTDDRPTLDIDMHWLARHPEGDEAKNAIVKILRTQER
jgi:iron(III) transport system substrate-binding protein